MSGCRSRCCCRRDSRWRRYLVSTSGLELLEASADGRGRLLLVPHFGNWELFSLILGPFGVTALYDPPKLKSLEPLIRAVRELAR